MAKLEERLSASVSDGAPVDWIRETAVRPESRSSIEQLAILSRIREAHETAAASLADDEETSTRTETAVHEEPILFRWGRLEVRELIGQGGGGEVYRAFDPSLHAEVALKLLRPDRSGSDGLARKFLAEAAKLARVRHQNVLIVHGADMHDGRAGIWTEYVQGRSLEHFLQEHGTLSACEAAVIGLDLCKALAAVHAAGLVHRDVKTSNVMREDRGRIILMDFGSVSEWSEEGGAAGSPEGTPLTMAPEQLLGGRVDRAADLYGLGALLYRLVSARYPVEGRSLAEQLEKHRRGDRVPLRDRRADLPTDFVQVVERAIAPAPEDRFASAGEMEQALASTIFNMGRDRKQREKWRRYRTAALLLVTLTAGVVFGANSREVIGLFGGGVPDTTEPAPAPPAAPSIDTLSATISVTRLEGDRETRLAEGSRVMLGDSLAMLLAGSDSLYVYVLNEDANGEINVLYPVRGLLPANPLPPRIEHRLPGDLGSGVVYWKVTSSGGVEHIDVIGSRTPLTRLETAIAELPRARVGRPVRFGKIVADAVRSLRGLESGAVAKPPAGESRRRLAENLRALEEEGLETGNIFVRRIRFANP